MLQHKYSSNYSLDHCTDIQVAGRVLAGSELTEVSHEQFGMFNC
jgi:hypothetical protein